MTNEEKAKEISDAYANSKFIPTQEECVAYSSAMQMAEWKEQQMIDKACKWLEENVGEYEDIYYDVGGFVSPDFNTEKFIKDFKKAMEE